MTTPKQFNIIAKIKNFKEEEMIRIGLEVVELEMYEDTEGYVFRLENELWEMNK